MNFLNKLYVFATNIFHAMIEARELAISDRLARQYHHWE